MPQTISAGMARRFAEALASSAAALWLVDVLVNLGLAGATVRGEFSLAGPRDFLGLLAAESPFAIATAAFAVVGATIVAARSRQGAGRELVVLLPASATALVVAGRFAWPFDASRIGIAVFAAATVGLFSLWLLRRWSTRTSESELSLSVRFGAATGLPVLGAFTARIAVEADPLPAVGAALASGAAILAWSRGSARRRRFAGWALPTIGLVTAALTCLMASRYPDPATLVRGSEAMRPNLALIVLDTVRADHLSLYGYGRETMPAFERWAQTALVVDRAVSPAGWTSPAHASLFSGLTVSKHGLHYSADASPTAALATSAKEDVVWLPERLQEMGYYCLAVSANAIAVPPSGAGFDRILTPDRNAWNGFTIGGLADRLVPFTARLSERLRWRMPYAGAKAVADAAIRALPLDAGPTFLFVNFVDAHSPYNPPADAVEALGLVPPPGFSRYKYHTDLTREWTLLPQSAKERLSELYDAELRGLDGELDRLLRELEIRLGPDALIVVTSDHGEELGEEGRVGHEFGLSQSLIHVPLLVKSRRLGPGRLEGPVSTRRVHDLLWRTASGEAPSISEWTAAQPAIAERYPSGTNARTLGAEYRRAWTALVSRNEKGVGPSESGFEATALGDDFHSSGELAGAEAEELRKAVDGYWRSSRDERNAGRALRKEDLDRLRSLGYIN